MVVHRPIVTQPLQGCAFDKITFVNPGLPKRNPGLELANAFGVGPDLSGLATLKYDSSFEPAKSSKSMTTMQPQVAIVCR